MNLTKLLDGVTVSKMFHTHYGQMVVTQDIQINHIQHDSRKVQRGDLFVAIRGLESDGHQFIKNAIASGAVVTVIENDTILDDSYFLHSGAMKIVVPNSRIALAQISANYFNHPSKKLKIFGVTGTNGKTTSTYLLKSILDHSGEKTGLLGTIEYKIGEEVITATHTTPESLELNGYLERMVKAGCTSAAMEVSSHALAQHRVRGVNFACAIFTNLTQDHLDYHETMNKYFKAKKILFDSLSPSSWAVVNIDDEWGRKIYRTTAARVLTYGTNSSADVQAKNISLTLRETKFTLVVNVKEINIESCLIGRFNVYNILAACSAGIALGIPITTLQDAISQAPAIHGRFEQIASPSGWIAIVDYAHTHDALDKALKTIHDVFANSKQGKIIAVFGCGGNRDRGKRPKMAQVASSLSDITIVTSDNPRNEDPNTIINEVIKGIKTGSRFYCEVDRKKAIFMALDLAAKDDIVLIAGKGHEDYQIIGNQKVHFSDKEVVEEYLRLHT